MPNTAQKRGELTKRIKLASKRLLGYEITQQELRLMPYIQFVVTNEQYIDRSKINREESEIISEWSEKGYVERSYDGTLTISKEFFMAICEILYLGYVDIIKD